MCTSRSSVISKQWLTKDLHASTSRCDRIEHASSSPFDARHESWLVRPKARPAAGPRPRPAIATTALTRLAC